MSQRSVEEALGRLLTDRGWRHRFVAMPEQACREEMYSLSSSEIAVLLGLDPLVLDFLAARIDHSIIRAESRAAAYGIEPRNGAVDRH